MITLRPYQKKAGDLVFKEWESVRSTLIICPTGGGKTLIFSDIIRRHGGRALMICHRQELIWQARDKIEKVTRLRADVEMGEYKSSQEPGLFHPKAQVILATVQTLTAGGDGGGRLSKFSPDDFGVLIVDECHRGTAESFKRVIKYFLQNPKLVVLGVTATPDRADEEALGQVFDTVAFDYEIIDAIKDGWLVPVDQQMVSVESLDFSGVKTTAGDLNGADLAAVMENEKNLHGVASSTISIIGDKRGIGFASSVNHARILSDIFNRHRSGMAAWVCGKTNKDERRKIIQDFARGEIQFLWNCGVFTEGFDDSGVEIISMARPTKSRSLYAQMAGRSTRPHESIAHRLNECPNAALRRAMIARSCKPSALIIDFVGNSGKHKLVTTADILGGNVSDEVIAAAVAAARKSGKRVRMDKSIEEEEKRLEEQKKRELEEQARKAKLVANAKFTTKKVDPFNIFDLKPVQPRGWDVNKLPSPGMCNVLRKMGLDPQDYTYTQARQLVSAQIDRWHNNLCSLKQAKLLKQFGYDSNVTFEKASEIITKIKNAGWKRPAETANVKVPKRKETIDQTINSDEPY